MKALVTGFEPFGGNSTNSSWAAVSLLPDELAGCTLVKKCIPVVFNKVGDCISQLIAEEQPDIVLMVGQRGGSGTIDCERVALNLADSMQPDNDGFIANELPLQPNSPTAYFGTVPLKKIISNLREAGIPANISNTAGTYVCNCLYYNALHYCKNHKPNTQVGFIHLPNLPQQVIGKVRVPSLPAEFTKEALLIALKTTISNIGIYV